MLCMLHGKSLSRHTQLVCYYTVSLNEGLLFILRLVIIYLYNKFFIMLEYINIRVKHA